MPALCIVPATNQNKPLSMLRSRATESLYILLKLPKTAIFSDITFNHPQSCKARNFFIRKSFLIMQRYSKALINDQTSTTQLKISHIIAPAFSWNYRNSPHFQTFKLQKILSSVLHHNLISDHAKRHWLIHLQDRLSTENFKPAEQMGKLKQDYHHYYSNIQRSHHAIYPKNDTTPAFRSERSDSNIP